MTRLIKLSPKKRFKALRKKQTHKRHDPSLGGLVDQSQQQYYDDDLVDQSQQQYYDDDLIDQSQQQYYDDDLIDQSQQQYYDDDLTYDNIPFQSDIHDQSIKYVQDHNSTIDSLNETQFLFQFMNHNCRDKSPEIGKEGRKMATCLAWTYYNNSQSLITHNKLEEWSYDLITQHTDLINEYIHNHLCKYLLYKFTTVKLWVTQVLEPFIQWYTEKRPNCGVYYVITGSMIYKLDKFISNLVKMCNRKKKSGTRSRKTKKDYIEKRILPPGNVNQTLIDLCRNKYNIYKCIDKDFINKVIYTHFLQVLVTAFWTGPQGRCKAIELLTYQEGLQLLDKNKYVEKYDFKNCDRLITQPILSYGILR